MANNIAHGCGLCSVAVREFMCYVPARLCVILWFVVLELCCVYTYKLVCMLVCGCVCVRVCVCAWALRHSICLSVDVLVVIWTISVPFWRLPFQVWWCVLSWACNVVCIFIRIVSVCAPLWLCLAVCDSSACA